MPQLEETASGVKCTACDKLFIYDFDQGTFFESDALPRSFCNLKKSIRVHCESHKHKENVITIKKNAAAYSAQLESARSYGLNCAAIAYNCFYFGHSYRSYEHAIANTYSANGSVGYKNHSKEFPRLFLPSVYNILRDNLNPITANIAQMP